MTQTWSWVPWFARVGWCPGIREASKPPDASRTPSQRLDRPRGDGLRTGFRDDAKHLISEPAPGGPRSYIASWPLAHVVAGEGFEPSKLAMDLQTLSGKPVTSENVLSANNFRLYSPQTADFSGGQPNTHGRAWTFPLAAFTGCENHRMVTPPPPISLPAGNEWGATWPMSAVRTMRMPS